MSALRLFIAIALIALSSFIDTFADSSPFQFLRSNGSARATALAGSFVSVIEDPTAVFYNPASIYTVSQRNFSATVLKHVLDINSGQLSYIFPGKKAWALDGVISTSISYTNFGSFDYIDKNANKNGTFGANNLSLAATYANELDSNLFYGVTLELLYVNYEKSNSTAMAIDVGMLYKLADNRTNIGLSVLNVGTQLSTLDGTRESLPLDVRLGINHRLKGLPLLMNFSFHHLADGTDKFFDKFTSFSIGGELYLGKYLQARLGYDNQIRRYTAPEADRKLSGFSAGVGIQTTSINFDYGAAQMGTAALLHRISLSLNL
jgi:hypothetical protein